MTRNAMNPFLLVLPSWIPPNTWSLGRTRLWTVFKSSTQPTLWSSFGTQSRKPKGKMQSILLIFCLQVRFHLDFQEAITHRRFITLSVILASPLKLTMACKELFPRHFVFFRILKKNFFFLVSIFFLPLINIFFPLPVRDLIYSAMGFKSSSWAQWHLFPAVPYSLFFSQFSCFLFKIIALLEQSTSKKKG